MLTAQAGASEPKHISAQQYSCNKKAPLGGGSGLKL